MCPATTSVRYQPRRPALRPAKTQVVKSRPASRPATTPVRYHHYTRHTGCQVSPGIVPGHDICEVPGWRRSFSLAKFRAGGPGPRQVKEGGAELCPGATLLEGEEGTSPLGAASRATNVKPRRPRSTSTALWATAEQGTKHPPLRVPPANCIGLPPHLVLVLSRQTSRTGLRVSPVTWDGKLRQ